jgi:hypothetical protein
MGRIFTRMPAAFKSFTAEPRLMELEAHRQGIADVNGLDARP